MSLSQKKRSEAKKRGKRRKKRPIKSSTVETASPSRVGGSEDLEVVVGALIEQQCDEQCLQCDGVIGRESRPKSPGKDAGGVPDELREDNPVQSGFLYVCMDVYNDPC